MKWVIENELARSSRPGYPSEEVFRETVDPWLADVKAAGIRSVICLLADDQLQFYRDLPDGLCAYYREAGLEVAHVPERDYQNPPLSDNILERVWNAFQTLPRPTLIHCSAGIDRTGSAVSEIMKRSQT